MEGFIITMKITNNVAMLEITGNFGAIYPTLVWDENRVALIDAGFPGQIGLFTEAITGAAISVEDITDIILTHQDMDHIGCVQELLALAPSAKIWAHEQEAPYLDGTKTPVKLAALLENYDNLPADLKAWCDRMQEGFANRRFQNIQAIKDGDVLPICGGIEVIHTPGHTPGHICLYLRESKIMVGGDALNIADGKMTGPNPQHTYDMELGLKSLEKAKSFDISGLISYHCGFLKIIYN